MARPLKTRRNLATTEKREGSFGEEGFAGLVRGHGTFLITVYGRNRGDLTNEQTLGVHKHNFKVQ
jgi:hypothetical protein